MLQQCQTKSDTCTQTTVRGCPISLWAWAISRKSVTFPKSRVNLKCEVWTKAANVLQRHIQQCSLSLGASPEPPDPAMWFTRNLSLPPGQRNTAWAGLTTQANHLLAAVILFLDRQASPFTEAEPRMHNQLLWIMVTSTNTAFLEGTSPRKTKEWINARVLTALEGPAACSV